MAHAAELRLHRGKLTRSCATMPCLLKCASLRIGPAGTGKQVNLFLDFIGAWGISLIVRKSRLAMDGSVRDSGLIIELILVLIHSMSANRIHTSL